MRRTLTALAAGLTAAALACSVASAPARADDPTAPAPDRSVTSSPLRTAATLLGEPATSQDYSSALARLRMRLPDLSPADRARARTLLARPTDGPADPEQMGYSVPETTPLCDASFCVHYVATTEDAPAAVDANANAIPDQVETTLQVMSSVLAFESGTLGYRPPASDGVKGGDGRFDVYLAELGSLGLYGYCAPEDPTPAGKWRYSGYCVLDNDYAGFPMGPLESLTVTAAHEFFHAIQFNYDASEDRWFMEATATWIEERFADDINDNRQYVRHGQLKHPSLPLDAYLPGSSAYYGNWIFFELLSEQYGVDAVRQAWEQVDSTRGAPDHYSTAGIARVLSSRGVKFRDFYARFAAANLNPARSYEEGAAFPSAPYAKRLSLSKKRPAVAEAKVLDHLTSASYQLRPGRTLKRGWKVKIKVDGPSVVTGASVVAVIYPRGGTPVTRTLKLDRRGDGQLRSRFNRRDIRRITLTLANGSTRFKRCFRDTLFSCQGQPRDDARDYAFTAKILR